MNTMPPPPYSAGGHRAYQPPMNGYAPAPPVMQQQSSNTVSNKYSNHKQNMRRSTFIHIKKCLKLPHHVKSRFAVAKWYAFMS